MTETEFTRWVIRHQKMFIHRNFGVEMVVYYAKKKTHTHAFKKLFAGLGSRMHMNRRKKAIRSAFRAAVFTRDKYRCVCCSYYAGPEGAAINEIDAHHITDRHEMPNGGYVRENGITLCNGCHLSAEMYHTSGDGPRGYSPTELYALIGSSLHFAIIASHKLGDRI